MASRTLAPALRRLLGWQPAKVQTKGYSGRVSSFFRQYVVPGQPYTVDWNTDRAVREGFEVNPWIYRAVHVTASKLIGWEMVLRQGHPVKGVPIPASADPTRLLHVFNVQANPWERAKVFRYRLIAQWLLSSKGVFIEIRRSRAGRIAMLTLLDPDQIEILPTVIGENPDGTKQVDPIGAFRVTVNDGSGPFNELPRFDPKAGFEEQPGAVLWVRSPHPTMMFRGMAPIQAAALSADMDKAARLYNKRFMDQDGRPGGIVLVKGHANKDTLEIIEARVNGGPGSLGRMTAIEGDALEFVDTSGNPRDTQWADTMDRMRKEVSIAFGTPESVLGDASGRCVDMETEALTQRGWLRGDEITTGDTILSMDPKDGRLKWSPVHEVYRAHYRGDMYRLRHAHADYLVTPGHNWAVESRPRDQRQGVSTPYLLRKVEELSTHDRIRTIGDAEAGPAEAVYSNAFVELVGWAVTEGYYFPNESSRKTTLNKIAPYVRIRQNSGELADRIAACAKESGARLAVHERDGRTLVNVRGEIAAALHQVAPGKIMSTTFLLALTAEQRDLLMRTMLDADGCTDVPNTASWTFAQKDRRATEAFVFLATLCGYTTSVREREFTYRHKGVERPARDWLAVVRRRKVMTIQRDTRTVENFDGLVWCPRTDYGTFVARRHGKVILTGNTFDNADAEKANWLEDTVTDLADLLDDQLDILTGSWDDALFLRHDYSKEWLLGRHKRDEIDRASEDLRGGRITINQWRVIAGKDEIDEPYARVLFLPAGTVLAGDEADVKAVAKLPMLGSPQAADPGVEARQGATVGSRAGVREADNINSATRLRLLTQASRGGNGSQALEQRDMAAALPAGELEGKEGGARAGGGDAAAWR